MKKLAAVSIVAIIILAAVGALLCGWIWVLQKRNSELENRNIELEELLTKVTNQVDITEFSIVGFKPYKELIIYESNVNIKIRNFGINNVKNLTLEIVGFGDERLAETLQIDIIHAGEEQELSTHAYWAYGSYGTSTVTLKLGNNTLDEYSLPYSMT